MARNNPPLTHLRGIYYLAISLATAALATGYGLAGQPWMSLTLVLLAAGWLWGERRGWSWVSSIGLIVWVLLAAAGLLFSVSPGWAIAAIGACLAGWDIGRFNRYMADAKRVDGTETLERRYRRRLLTVVTLGSTLAIAATYLRLNFGFGAALLLGLISIVGFSRAISYLRQESD